MTVAESKVLEVAKAYSQICKDCEEYRTNDDPPPRTRWSKAWDQRMKLATELLTAAEALGKESKDN